MAEKPRRARCVRSCDACEKELVKQLRCSGCENRFYCGVACQKADWRDHREACLRARELPPETRRLYLRNAKAVRLLASALAEDAGGERIVLWGLASILRLNVRRESSRDLTLDDMRRHSFFVTFVGDADDIVIGDRGLMLQALRAELAESYARLAAGKPARDSRFSGFIRRRALDEADAQKIERIGLPEPHYMFYVDAMCDNDEREMPPTGAVFPIHDRTLTDDASLRAFLDSYETRIVDARGREHKV